MDSARIPRPSPAIPPAPRGHRPRISVTPETLPPGQVARPVTIPDAHGPGLDHYTVYLDTDQLASGGAGLLVATYRALCGPIRPHIWRMTGVPDPAIDPAGYLAARWWDPGTPIDMGLIRYTEALGRSYPWPHGRSRGPLLSPSRA